jgi:hypothetical protein
MEECEYVFERKYLYMNHRYTKVPEIKCNKIIFKELKKSVTCYILNEVKLLMDKRRNVE